MTERRVLVDTCVGRLNVRTVGDGPPAVLWHSMFVDSRTWDRVIPALSGQRRLIIVDGPSFGGSDPLRRMSSIGECADAAAEVCQRMGAETVDWVGNAWGGHVGISLAASRPGLVSSLCSIGAPTHPLAGMERVQVVALRPVVRRIGFPGAISKVIISALLSDQVRTEDPEAVAIVRSGFETVGREAFDFALRSFVMGRTDLSAEAKALVMPVLFAAGDDRGEWTPGQAAEITAAMVDARTVTLPGVRGIAPLENPALVTGLILDFWSGR